MSGGQAEKELEHLLQIEEKLLGVLNKINQELAQNEVEYLHLKSLIEPYNNQCRQGVQGDVPSQVVEAKPVTPSVKIESNFEASLNADLDLRPFVKMLDDDVEYDSDLDDIIE